MKPLTLTIAATMLASVAFSQKPVAPPEGDYSDPSGLSGTYYPTSALPYNGGKKVCSLVKIEYKADDNSVTMHAIKAEPDPSVFYMADYRTFARDKFKVSQFSAGDFHIFTVEPGVLVVGAYMWAPEDYPGYKKDMMIADTSVLKPVILVKDEAMKSKYTYADAKRIMGEKGTLSEVHNTLRFAEKTPLPSIGTMTSDKKLIEKSVELMKVKWADSKEPSNLLGCYIHSNEWGTVQYGSVQGTSKLTFSDEVTAIMLFKEPETGICYYYAVGISRESEDITHKGIETERGLHMTGSSTIQYITEEKLNTCLTEIK
ncbi:MAG: hypothetical protein V4604_10730 [Bacteroidota bacterium]